MSDDLWGEFPEATPINHPKTILTEQANILAQRTGGILQGSVAASRADVFRNCDTALRFSIVCPALLNYSFEVLTVGYQRLDVYPCEIHTWEGSGFEIAGDEEQFKSLVRSIFQSDRVKRAIAALLRDAKEDSNQHVTGRGA